MASSINIDNPEVFRAKHFPDGDLVVDTITVKQVSLRKWQYTFTRTSDKDVILNTISDTFDHRLKESEIFKLIELWSV